MLMVWSLKTQMLMIKMVTIMKLLLYEEKTGDDDDDVEC